MKRKERQMNRRGFTRTILGAMRALAVSPGELWTTTPAAANPWAQGLRASRVMTRT